MLQTLFGVSQWDVCRGAPCCAGADGSSVIEAVNLRWTRILMDFVEPNPFPDGGGSTGAAGLCNDGTIVAFLLHGWCRGLIIVLKTATLFSDSSFPEVALGPSNDSL